jgi:hypothetical protein
MLELGLDAAATYPGAAGPEPRTAELVREAAEKLAKPDQRLAWELWTPRAEVREVADSLDAALELHAEIERRAAAGDKITAGELDELGLAWELAFESEDVGDRAAERAAELGAGDPDRAVAELSRELDESLAALLDQAPPVDLDDVESERLAEVAARRDDAAIDRLEVACDRYVDGDASIYDWRGLTSLFWNVVKGRGEQVRATAFYAIYNTLAGHAHDRYADGDYETAGRVFGWMSARAEAIGDLEAAGREGDNARICEERSRWDQRDAIETPITAHESSGGGSWSWLWIIGVLVLLLARAGRTCDNSPSYSPPRFDPPPMPNIERLSDDLQRSFENSVRYRGHDPYRFTPPPGCSLPMYDTDLGRYICLDADAGAAEMEDGRRTRSPPAVAPLDGGL